MICLDDCPSPIASRDEAAASVERTVHWAGRCRAEFDRLLAARKKGSGPRPLLFGVVQGGYDPALRRRCAEQLLPLGFDGFGFGGWPLTPGGDLAEEILALTAGLIPDPLPRFALGVGKPEHIVRCYQMGWRIFDTVLPTRDARHQRLYAFDAPYLDQVDVRARSFYHFVYAGDKKHTRQTGPISTACDCPCCRNYSLAYLHHLFGRKRRAGLPAGDATTCGSIPSCWSLFQALRRCQMEGFTLEEAERLYRPRQAATYVGGGTRSLSYRPALTTSVPRGWLLLPGQLLWRADFIGQEVVYFEGRPVWAVNYYGRILDTARIEAQEAGQVIQHSLSEMYRQGRFLGGFEHTVGAYTYVDSSEGAVDSFGARRIMRDGVVVYRLVYHGSDQIGRRLKRRQVCPFRLPHFIEHRLDLGRRAHRRRQRSSSRAWSAAPAAFTTASTSGSWTYMCAASRATNCGGSEPKRTGCRPAPSTSTATSTHPLAGRLSISPAFSTLPWMTARPACFPRLGDRGGILAAALEGIRSCRPGSRGSSRRSGPPAPASCWRKSRFAQKPFRV